MKKIKFMFLFVIIEMLFLPNASALELIRDSNYTGIEENEVQIRSLNIKNAKATFSDGFAIRVNKQYTNSEYAPGGKFDRERNSQVSFNDTTANSNTVVYTKPLSAGTHNNIGSIVLVWERAAYLQNGTLCDVKLTINNITIKNNRNTSKPIEILNNGGNNSVLWMAIRYAKQEVSAANLNKSHNIPLRDISAKYDVSFEFMTSSSKKRLIKM